MKNGARHAEAAAERMIERFGESALREIDLRLLELDAHGEEKAKDLWKEIRKIVAKRLRTVEGSD